MANENAALPAEPRRLARPNAGSAVVEHVRRLVFDGQLRQGDKVPQQEIADALGVSRIPVREALVALERDGVVTIEPHRGAFVNAFDPAAIEDHYELYGLVYGHATRRTAERADERTRVELERLAAAIADASDPESLFERVGHFHAVIHQVGGSPRLRAILRSLSAIVPGNFFAVIPGSKEIVREGFSDIAAAIRARDAREAEARCRAMHRAHGAGVTRYLKERGLFRDV